MNVLIEIVNDINNVIIDKIVNYIVDSNIPKYIYKLALSNKNINIELLENKIIEINQITYLCQFGINVEKANILKIEKVLRNCKEEKYISDICVFYEIMVKRKKIDINNYAEFLINVKILDICMNS